MIIESIAFENFMRYVRRCELDFSGKSTIGIVGQNEAGKSSILQAITYGIYGRTRAEREVQLISDNGTGDLLVDLALRFPDDSLLEITRGRTRKNEAVLKVAGQSGKPSDLAEYIAEKVQLSYDDYIALTYFVQGDIHQFMGGNKRAYFQRWTEGLRLWQRYETVASSRIMGLEEYISGANYELEICKETLDSATIIKAEERAAKMAMATAEDQVHLISGQVERLRDEYQKVAETGKDMESASVDLENQISECQVILRTSRNNLANTQRDLKNISTGRCPLLDIHCDELKISGEPEREKALKRKGIFEARISQAEKQLTALEARLQASKQKAKDTYAEKLGKLRDAMREAQQSERDARNDHRSASSRYEVARERASKLKETAARAKELKGNKAKWEEDLRRLQFVRFMCSKSGIPAMLIEGELERVEERCNWVLERLDYPKRIRFSGFKELASFEKVCPVCGSESWHKEVCKSCGAARPRKRKEEPTVTVLEGPNERPFALESGGAQVLQSFAVRLASSLFVSAMTGVPMRMVLLDEVFGMLDGDNRQKLMSLVIDKLANEFGLQQQFVVSHQEDVVNAVDDLLIIRSERGSAVARWA